VTNPGVRAVSHRFAELLTKRAAGGDPKTLAAALSAMSPGRAPSVWETLPGCPTQFVFVAGALDAKFAGIGKKLAASCGASPQGSRELPASGGPSPQGSGNLAARSAANPQASAKPAVSGGVSPQGSGKLAAVGGPSPQEGSGKKGASGGTSPNGVLHASGLGVGSRREAGCKPSSGVRGIEVKEGKAEGKGSDVSWGGAGFVSVEGCGHAVHVERPEALLSLLLPLVTGE
jgi:hypothetical protein